MLRFPDITKRSTMSIPDSFPIPLGVRIEHLFPDDQESMSLLKIGYLSFGLDFPKIKEEEIDYYLMCLTYSEIAVINGPRGIEGPSSEFF